MLQSVASRRVAGCQKFGGVTSYPRGRSSQRPSSWQSRARRAHSPPMTFVRHHAAWIASAQAVTQRRVLFDQEQHPERLSGPLMGYIVPVER